MTRKYIALSEEEKFAAYIANIKPNDFIDIIRKIAQKPSGETLSADEIFQSIVNDSKVNVVFLDNTPARGFSELSRLRKKYIGNILNNILMELKEAGWITLSRSSRASSIYKLVQDKTLSIDTLPESVKAFFPFAPKYQLVPLNNQSRKEIISIKKDNNYISLQTYRDFTKYLDHLSDEEYARFFCTAENTFSLSSVCDRLRNYLRKKESIVTWEPEEHDDINGWVSYTDINPLLKKFIQPKLDYTVQTGMITITSETHYQKTEKGNIATLAEWVEAIKLASTNNSDSRKDDNPLKKQRKTIDLTEEGQQASAVNQQAPATAIDQPPAAQQNRQMPMAPGYIPVYSSPTDRIPVGFLPFFSPFSPNQQLAGMQATTESNQQATPTRRQPGSKSGG